MIHYELQFTGCLDRVQIHLRGFWALISNHPFFCEDRTRSGDLLMDLSNPHLVLSCQLTGWALFVDSSPALSGFIHLTFEIDILISQPQASVCLPRF